MPFNDLRDFIRALEKKKELKRISLEVDPFLEITEFADRSVKTGGPALLFENPKGSKIPVLINAYASIERMELALGVDSVDEIAARITEYLEMRMPQGPDRQTQNAAEAGRNGFLFPRIVDGGPCKKSSPQRQLLPQRIPGSALLAAGRRPFHHAAHGLLA